MLWKRDHAGVTGRVCDSLADRQVSSYSRPRLFLPDECWLLLWACDGSVAINNLCWLGWRLSHLVFLVVEKELEPESLGENCCVFTLLPRSFSKSGVSSRKCSQHADLWVHFSSQKDYVGSLWIIYCTSGWTLIRKSITAFQKCLIIVDEFCLPLVCIVMTDSSLKLRTVEVYTGQTQSLQRFASHFCYWM